MPSPARLLIAVVFVLDAGLLAAQSTGGYWPQFRGPDRSNRSPDTGLLKAWPKEGPPLLWKVTDLGTGMAPVSIAEGRVYTLAFRMGTEYAVALDRGTGKEIWAVPLGPGRQEAGMQFHFQRQPVVDRDRLFVFSANAVLFALETDSGRLLWKKDYRRDFGARARSFGQNDHPLVDGERLICTPGGKEATMVALNKRTGEVIWKAVVPKGDSASHSPVVIAEAGGIRQYVELLSHGLVGIAAEDGRFLWRYDRVSNGTINVPAPLVQGERIFVSSAYGVGSALLELAADGKNAGGAKVQVKELYFTRDFQNLNGGMVLVGEHVYGAHRHGISGGPLGCLHWKTGKILWSHPGDCTNVLEAEGLLYCRHTSGLITLVEATPEGYREKGRFQPSKGRPAWTYLVVTGQRLYVRDQSLLLCYDLRAQPPQPVPAGKETPPPLDKGTSRLPDAVFVPTPHDVVDRMLELAAVKKEDVVVDLGCGDGRIPIRAARRFGCKAIGYDLDEECVRMARADVRKQKVEALVRIVHEDAFRVDLRDADVVALYLLPELNVKLIPQLAKMKPGARIVSHAFDMPGVVPDRVVAFTSREDEVERKLFLWTVPLKKR